MSLIQSAKLNGHDPYDYLKDVLKRLPTQRNSMIEELLPHRWRPAGLIYLHSPRAAVKMGSLCAYFVVTLLTTQIE